MQNEQPICKSACVMAIGKIALQKQAYSKYLVTILA